MLPTEQQKNEQAIASTLSRESPLPLYEQLRRRLLSMVLAWPAEDERFHTDQELSELFGVSRMTVRQAVQELVVGGYLRRARGSGTFVCTPKVSEHFSLQSSFIDQWADFGQDLQFEVLKCACKPATAKVAQQLGITLGAKVWCIVRRRKVREIPISIDYRYIPVSIVENVEQDQVGTTSLLALLNQHVTLSYGDLTVEAASADHEQADSLGLLDGDPILIRTLRYHDDQERVVMAGVSFYHAGQVRYSVRVPLNDETAKGVEVKDKLEFKAFAR